MLIIKVCIKIFCVKLRVYNICPKSTLTVNIVPTNEATPIQVSTSEYPSLTTSSAQAPPPSSIVTSSPGLTTYVSEEVVIDEPVIVTSEDVPSAGVEGEESVEVLVTDDAGDVVTLPATQEIIQEVGEVRVL